MSLLQQPPNFLGNLWAQLNGSKISQNDIMWGDWEHFSHPATLSLYDLSEQLSLVWGKQTKSKIQQLDATRFFVHHEGPGPSPQSCSAVAVWGAATNVPPVFPRPVRLRRLRPAIAQRPWRGSEPTKPTLRLAIPRRMPTRPPGSLYGLVSWGTYLPFFLAQINVPRNIQKYQEITI